MPKIELSPEKILDIVVKSSMESSEMSEKKKKFCDLRPSRN